MAKSRAGLPQLNGSFFLTDGGLETTLIFHEGLDLPEFAAFDLLRDDVGYASLHNYFRTYALLAGKYGVGLVLESATWRANPDWGIKLGASDGELAEMNRKAVALLCDIRDKYEVETSPMVISGCIVPRGDGYIPTAVMAAEEAQRYHQPQIDMFSQTAADMATAITINDVEESIGITRAATAAGMPIVTSFTLETAASCPPVSLCERLSSAWTKQLNAVPCIT